MGRSFDDGGISDMGGEDNWGYYVNLGHCAEIGGGEPFHFSLRAIIVCP